MGFSNHACVITNRQAVGLFVARADSSKIMDRCYRANLNVIKDCHHALWPGVPVDLLQPKQSAETAAVSSKHQKTQTLWTRESTMPTSMLVAFVLFSVNTKNRSLASRAYASEAFAGLVSLLASTLGGFQIGHCKFGSDEVTMLCVDSAGNVQGWEFWAPQFYQRFAHGQWLRDLKNEQKTWLKSATGLAKLPLVEVLTFCLDTQHRTEFQDLVKHEILNVLTELADVLDREVLRLRADLEQIPAASTSKNSAKMRMRSTVLVEQVSNSIWAGQDTCLHVCFI